jgi:hypothetical protein
LGVGPVVIHSEKRYRPLGAVSAIEIETIEFNYRNHLWSRRNPNLFQLGIGMPAPLKDGDALAVGSF